MTLAALGITLPTIGGDNDTYAPKINNGIESLANELTTKTVDINFADKQLKSAVLRDTSELFTAASVSGDVTLDYSASNHHSLTLTGNVTSLAFSNVPTQAYMVIWLRQDATGSRTIAFPSSFKFNTSTPILSTGANVTDELQLKTLNGGTTWQATLAKGWAGL
jgi:hypothetical protein